jgi:hypothetical protein
MVAIIGLTEKLLNPFKSEFYLDIALRVGVLVTIIEVIKRNKSQ